MVETTENQPFTNENPAAAPISEDEIKRAVVPFLRNFYKNRYAISYGTVSADFDVEDAAGHHVDSRLTFNKEDGSPFSCAVEATAADNLSEIKYELNGPYFGWAVGASACFTLGVFYLFMWRLRPVWVYELGLLGNLGMVLLMGAMLATAYFYGLRNREKFRYIYAVEQFKTFQADEKWCAVASAAFPEPDDKWLAELRKQLVFNGNGLLLVSDTGEVRPLVTPSRLGAFGEKHRTFDYFLDSDFIWRGYQMTRSRPARWFGSFLGKGWRMSKASRLTDPTHRFMRSYFHQKLLAAAGLCIVGIVVWKTRDYRAVDFVDEKQHRAAMLKAADLPEDESYMPGDKIYFKKRPPEYLPADAPAPEPDLSGEPDLSRPDSEAVFFEKLAGRKPAVVAKRPFEQGPLGKTPTAPKPSAAPKPASDGCETWSNKKGWVVQDNYFGTLDFARERRAELLKNGFEASLARRNCLFENQSGGWVTLLGGVFSNENSARSAAASFQKRLARLRLERGPVIVKKLIGR